MRCTCGHMPYHHNQGCGVCLKCGRMKPGPGKDCCLLPKRCPCNRYVQAQEAS